METGSLPCLCSGRCGEGVIALSVSWSSRLLRWQSIGPMACCVVGLTSDLLSLSLQPDAVTAVTSASD